MNGGSETSDGIDYPPIYQLAESRAAKYQRLYYLFTTMRLGFAVGAGIFATLADRYRSHDGPFAAAAVVMFGIAVIVEFYLYFGGPEESWLASRTVAESSKTLTWRYSVGGYPFRRVEDSDGGVVTDAVEEAEARAAFTSRLEFVLHETRFEYAPADHVLEVTWGMWELRSLSLAQRKRRYSAHRVSDQRLWYGQRSKDYRRKGDGFHGALLVAEVVGFALAVANTFHHLVGIPTTLSALVGALAAWLAIRQYDVLSRSYAYVGSQLDRAAKDLAHAVDEEAWAHAVADAEEEIQREHTMWRATRLREPQPELEY